MKKRLYYTSLLIALVACLVTSVLPLGQTATVYAATETLRPNGAGDYQEWETVVDTNHYGATSDQSDATYIETTGTSAKQDVQHLADPTFPEGDQVNSVTYYITAKATGVGGSELLYIMEKLGASERTTTQTITRDTWNNYSVTQTTDPDGASWTKQKVIDLQAGVQVEDNGPNDTLSVSEIWIVVDYTPPPAISNTPTSFDFGVLAEGAIVETTGGLTTAYFTVTNDSSYAVNITIGGTDLTGGTAWTLSDTATPETDTYGLKAGLEGGSYNIIVKSSSPNFLVEGLAASGTQDWALQLLAPTTFTGGGENSGTVTLTATQP